MDATLLSTLIGAVATIVAGLLGGIVGRSETWDRLVARNRFPNLVGTRWESSWTGNIDGVPQPHKEVFEFVSQKRNRVYGYITMDSLPDLKWEIEGDYNDRFLRLLWHPSKDARNKFILDYGCYFFERQGDGSFKGYAVGFDSFSNKIDNCEHTLKQLPSVRIV
jgi:hypothetical protein